MFVLQFLCYNSFYSVTQIKELTKLLFYEFIQHLDHMMRSLLVIIHEIVRESIYQILI